MGKMLLLSFENSEDDVISEILSILENKQMKICENRNIKKCLEFQGLTINAEKRLAVKGNKEIEFTFTEFEILLLLAQNAGMVFSKEKIYNIVCKEPYFGDYNIVMSHIRSRKYGAGSEKHNFLGRDSKEKRICCGNRTCRTGRRHYNGRGNKKSCAGDRKDGRKACYRKRA